MKIYRAKVKKDPIRFFLKTYNDQILRCKKRGHTPPTYSFDEFIQWLEAQPHLTDMWNAYQASDHDINLFPSVDRIDDDITYTLDNIQLVTWPENHEKLKNSVSAFHRDGSFYMDFDSVTEAAKHINRDVSGIRQSIRSDGHYKCAGYLWYYKK